MEPRAQRGPWLQPVAGSASSLRNLASTKSTFGFVHSFHPHGRAVTVGSRFASRGAFGDYYFSLLFFFSPQLIYLGEGQRAGKGRRFENSNL